MPESSNCVVRIYWILADGAPFYAGKTIYSLEERLAGHLKTARRYPRRRISRALKNRASTQIEIVLKEEVPPNVDWRIREMFWIAELRRVNPHAANSNEGGTGNKGHVHSKISRAKMSVQLRAKSRLSDDELTKRAIEHMNLQASVNAQRDAIKAAKLTKSRKDRDARKCKECWPANIDWSKVQQVPPLEVVNLHMLRFMRRKRSAKQTK